MLNHGAQSTTALTRILCENRGKTLRESISELVLRADHARCEKFQRRVERAIETRARASR